ncbi:hypothetical protein F0310_05005 (plasmid) [Borrelia sp. A-FGy1]|uniref:hypothetical protein n=1 Tax=Borrelia sp. A-FGy1 TaxID=2608247 RepID=UPI0015F43594|nr:hypothetical protein [Borrelia sp. A-FGy1]QMU99776.1 hypothetical protein F0310_05005 [Borrelia sp. A-FGy1]
MKYVIVLFIFLIVFIFSCKLCGGIKDIDNVASLLTDGQRSTFMNLNDINNKEKKISSLKEMLGNSSNVLYGNGNSSVKSRYEELFRWLKENDSDYSKRNQIESSIDKVFSLIKSSAPNSTEMKEIIEKGQDDENIVKSGIKSVIDIKTDTQVEALVKFITGPGSELDLNVGSSVIKFFFEELVQVFDNALYYAANGKKNEDKKERTNDDLFQDFIEVFSDKPDSPFVILRDSLLN